MKFSKKLGKKPVKNSAKCATMKFSKKSGKVAVKKSAKPATMKFILSRSLQPRCLERKSIKKPVGNKMADMKYIKLVTKKTLMMVYDTGGVECPQWVYDSYLDVHLPEEAQWKNIKNR